MEKAFSHTQVTPQKHTTEFMKATLVLGARYGGRFVFGFLEDWGVVKTKTANQLTSLFSGLIAGALTFALGKNVHSDIINVFAEPVGMEIGKKSSEVTWSDLKKSDNKLVQEALSNFKKFNLIRAGGVLGFLVGALPIPVPGVKTKFEKILADKTVIPAGTQMTTADGRGMELGMGTFVGAVAYDVYRKTSFFEQLNALLNSKFTDAGTGQTINASDLAQLFQRYATKHAPELAFSDVSDNRHWHEGEIAFERMAYLMERSYRPRANMAEVARGDAKEIRVSAQENFPMPVFVYLLGHGMINPEKPQETLAYIEIANSYGVQAAREVQQAIGKGISLEACIEKYPVTLPGEHLSVVNESKKQSPLDLTAMEPLRENRFSDMVGKRDVILPTIKTPNGMTAHLDTPPETQVARLAQQAEAATAVEQRI